MERTNAPADLAGQGSIPDRRSEPRTAANEEVSLKIRGWAGLPNPMPARIVNVSGHGVGLHTPQPVECGAQVEIEASRGIILGEVCRCQPESAGYSLGVRIADRSK